jgi:hypothetical protein
MKKLYIFFAILFIITPIYANSFWGFSLQEKSYYFNNYIDLGFQLNPFVPYSFIVYAPDINIRFWGGIDLNGFSRIGGGYKFYPNLVLNFEYRMNEKCLGILIPFILERLQGGIQVNIGVLGSTLFNIEGAFSYPINKLLSIGAYIFFPFKETGRVSIFGRYFWRNYYLTLASDGNFVSFSVLKYLKF